MKAHKCMGMLIGLCLCTMLPAQKLAVTFYDANWNPTSDRSQAAYYRTTGLDSVKQLYFVSDYYASGQLYKTGTCSSLNPEIREGLFTWYFQSGKKSKTVLYAGNKVLSWQVLNEKGVPQLAALLTFKGLNGEVLSEAFKVDKEPEFAGGSKAMKAYIRKKLIYPPVTTEKPIDGVVVVYCIVTDSGKLVNLNILKSVHPDLDREALRLVEQMPAWNPGLVNGIPVNVPYLIPVKFQNRSSQSYNRNNSERNKSNFSY